jgi:hypothetical protein
MRGVVLLLGVAAIAMVGWLGYRSTQENQTGHRIPRSGVSGWIIFGHTQKPAEELPFCIFKRPIAPVHQPCRLSGSAPKNKTRIWTEAGTSPLRPRQPTTSVPSR